MLAGAGLTMSAGRPAMLPGLLLAVLAVLTGPGPAVAQSSLYSDGGCRITDPGPEVNVTCTCRQTLQQTRDSPPINHLEIVGCLNDFPTAEITRLAFLELPAPGDGDFVLLHVRSVNISLTKLALEPVQGRAEAAAHPLERLHVEFSDLTRGLPDGALQGLPNLQHVTLLYVVTARPVEQSALSDLPRLRSLTITGCTFPFLKGRMLARTPQLRQLHITSTRLDFLRAGAIVVENDPNAAADDDDMCDFGGDVGLRSSPSPNAAFVFFANNSVSTMARNAITVSAVQQLVVSDNTIREMYPGAMNVTLWAHDGCQPLLQFTGNQVEDMREGALVVANDGGAMAELLVGGNILLRDALSPAQLQLRGMFQRQTDPALPPDQYDCSCCNCPSTLRLTAVVLDGQPDRLEKDVFVTALASAQCSNTAGSFLQFAAGCDPGANLTALVRQLVPSVTPIPPKGNAAAWLPAAAVLPLALAAALCG